MRDYRLQKAGTRASDGTWGAPTYCAACRHAPPCNTIPLKVGEGGTKVQDEMGLAYTPGAQAAPHPFSPHSRIDVYDGFTAGTRDVRQLLQVQRHMSTCTSLVGAGAADIAVCCSSCHRLLLPAGKGCTRVRCMRACSCPGPEKGGCAYPRHADVSLCAHTCTPPIPSLALLLLHVSTIAMHTHKHTHAHAQAHKHTQALHTHKCMHAQARLPTPTPTHAHVRAGNPPPTCPLAPSSFLQPAPCPG